MAYSAEQITKLTQKIIAKVTTELRIAQENGTVDEVVAKYGISFEEQAMPVNKRVSKILVFGALAGKLADFQLAAKKCGITKDNIVFETDYNRMHHYDVSTLKDSLVYSDIIFGPAPHKIEGMGDTSSFLATIEKNPNHYPRLIKSQANSSLKITVSNFKESLTRTRYFEMCNI